VRIVEVDQFDLSACGGTHVARTGEIGSIAALGFERYKGGTRLEFVCGGRALQAYQSLRDAAAAAARALGTSSAEMPVAAERLQNDLKQQRQIVRDLQRRLTDFEVERLLPTATRHRGVSVVAHRAPTSDLQVVKSLAAAVAMRSGHVAIVVAGDPLNVVVARAPDVSVDAAAIVRTLTARFGGRGGGRPEAAQAGGLAGDAGEILSAAIESL
jgi:alanyl-tRNA synthetase